MPHSSSALLYEEMCHERAEQSRQNVERRKQELLDQSELTSGVKSMLDRAEERALRGSRYRTPHSDRSFEQFRARGMPDFERLHKDFEAELAARRRSFTPTVPYAMNLTEAVTKPVEYPALDDGAPRDRREEIDRRLRKFLTTAPNQVYATRKVEDLVEFRKKQKYQRSMAEAKHEREWQSMKG